MFSAAGLSHSVIVTAGDRGGITGHCIYSWGLNKSGQLGLGEHGHKLRELSPKQVHNTALERVAFLSCGGSHTVIITSRGELWVAGRNRKGQMGLQPEENIRAFRRVSVPHDGKMGIWVPPSWLKPPDWSPELHFVFPSDFKEVVFVLLKIRTMNEETHTPKHPECDLWRLPREIFFMLIRYIAADWYN
eukprot:TRINITY_DN1061_c0_g1_i5.p1 TRINITY_DN1061_c0_g1~~TRINITY_DN1061_c0_g1_i5.p1  ORF type:complete len:189 (-),score=4.29 TRINITY_DN1061_c0_g1_i5:352-918(-)